MVGNKTEHWNEDNVKLHTSLWPPPLLRTSTSRPNQIKPSSQFSNPHRFSTHMHQQSTSSLSFLTAPIKYPSATIPPVEATHAWWFGLMPVRFFQPYGLSWTKPLFDAAREGFVKLNYGRTVSSDGRSYSSQDLKSSMYNLRDPWAAFKPPLLPIRKYTPTTSYLKTVTGHRKQIVKTS